jgi:mRNA interferase HigB
VRVISRRRLVEFWAAHADAESSLKTWFAVARKAKWQRLVDVQRTFASADAVGDFTVFNIKGNRYRLIAKIEYRLQIIFIKCILTHAEYDKDKWK